MTPRQRRAHLVVWIVMTPLLLAGVAVALWMRGSS